MAENNLNRALLISQGDWMILLRSPISAVFLGLSALSLAFPILSNIRSQVMEFRGRSGGQHPNT
jgi:putative tricarboxylic transport membrane protein